MKIETKEDALLHCYDLWLDMAVSGRKSKSGWSGWKQNGGYLNDCIEYCPCCEFSTHACSTTCREDCIIEWNEPKYSNSLCGKEFHSWHQSLSNYRHKYALEIAHLAMDALYKLYEGE